MEKFTTEFKKMSKENFNFIFNDLIFNKNLNFKSKIKNLDKIRIELSNCNDYIQSKVEYHNALLDVLATYNEENDKILIDKLHERILIIENILFRLEYEVQQKYKHLYKSINELFELKDYENCENVCDILFGIICDL